MPPRSHHSRPRRVNRCKSTLDTLIHPYLINIILFILIFFPTLLCGVIALPLYLLSCHAIIGSWSFCLTQHKLIADANYRLKGVRGIVLDSALPYAFHSFMLMCLALDVLLFPGIKHIRIESPVFIAGCPRSGTTFLHRVLTTPPSYIA